MRALAGVDRNGRQAVRAILGRRIGGRRCLFHLVHLADNQEYREGHNDKIQDRVDEYANLDRWRRRRRYGR